MRSLTVIMKKLVKNK